MRIWIAGLLLVASAGIARAQDCGEKYGTSVAWLRDAAAAAEKAKADGKLVFILHLSGELDDAEKT